MNDVMLRNMTWDTCSVKKHDINDVSFEKHDIKLIWDKPPNVLGVTSHIILEFVTEVTQQTKMPIYN